MRLTPLFKALLLAGMICTAGIVLATQDTGPPALLSFALSTRTLDTSAGAASTIMTVGVTDDLAGFAAGYVRFATHSSAQARLFSFYSSQRTAGSKTSGTYTVTALWPQASKTGTWRATHLYLYDQLGQGRVIFHPVWTFGTVSSARVDHAAGYAAYSTARHNYRTAFSIYSGVTIQ